MAESFAVNTDGLQRTANDLNVAADSVTTVVGVLRGKIDPLGTPWGDDEAGTAFRANYVQPAQEWQTTVLGIGTVFKSTSDGISEMAHGFQATEESSTEAASGGPPPAS